jgi:hypothetical protein
VPTYNSGPLNARRHVLDVFNSVSEEILMTKRTLTLTAPVATRDVRGRYYVTDAEERTSFVVNDGTPLRLADGRTVYACGPVVVSEQPPPTNLSRGTVFGGPQPEEARATTDRSHVTPADFGRVVSPREINEANRKFREQRAKEWDGPDAA